MTSIKDFVCLVPFIDNMKMVDRKTADLSASIESPLRKGITQRLRFWAQLFSAGVSVWIGVQFYLWVKYIEAGGVGWDVGRPPGVEGYLPIGSLVSLKYWLTTGIINDIHPSGLIIFFAIVTVSFLFKKAFCGWVCPVGFMSEMLGNISDRIWGRRLKPPAWLDYFLRSLKYVILGFFIWAILIQMDAFSIKSFLYSDYNIVSDILMLRFFTDITLLSLQVLTGLFILSLVIRGFWCRYLCPYGALLGLLSFISPTRIRRAKSLCTDCVSCRTVCPAFIKVDKVKSVVSDECVGCMACVDICPSEGALKIVTLPGKRRIDPLKWSIVALVVFWGFLFGFKLFGPWQNSIPDSEYIERMEPLNRGEYAHPGL